MSDRIEDFNGLEGQALPVSEVVDALTKLGAEKGFAQETLAPLYLIYRVMSTVSVHPTLNVLDSYFRKSGILVHVEREPQAETTLLSTLVTALFSTAYLAGWVLSERGCPTPVAYEIRKRFEPDITGRSSWAPANSPES